MQKPWNRKVPGELEEVIVSGMECMKRIVVGGMKLERNLGVYCHSKILKNSNCDRNSLEICPGK